MNIKKINIKLKVGNFYPNKLLKGREEEEKNNQKSLCSSTKCNTFLDEMSIYKIFLYFSDWEQVSEITIVKKVKKLNRKLISYI